MAIAFCTGEEDFGGAHFYNFRTEFVLALPGKQKMDLAGPKLVSYNFSACNIF